MEFWKMCFDLKVIDSNFLRQAVITDTNKFGDITVEQFKEITGDEFVKVAS
jgi:hypothetical protein